MVHKKPAKTLARFMASFAACGAALCLPNMASAQSTVSASASAQLIDGLSLTSVRDLDYGRVLVPRNGRIDMTADDASVCTPNNGLTLIDPCQSAQFEGTAITGQQIRISAPPGRRINLTGPDRDLRLRRMTVGAGNGVTFQGRTNRHFDFVVTDPFGEFEIFVAGRLLFRNNQGPGLYTGTFTIEASYE